GLLPPNSSVTRLRFERPAACITNLPTSVEPVKATLSMSMCSATAAPAVSPYPGTMFRTPGGNPASSASSPTRRALSGVCSAGFCRSVHIGFVAFSDVRDHLACRGIDRRKSFAAGGIDPTAVNEHFGLADLDGEFGSLPVPIFARGGSFSRGRQFSSFHKAE